MLRVFFNSIPNAQVALLQLTLYKVVFSKAIPFVSGAYLIEIALCFPDVGCVSTQSLYIVQLGLQFWQFTEESPAVFIDISVASWTIGSIEISFGCDQHCSSPL